MTSQAKSQIINDFILLFSAIIDQHANDESTLTADGAAMELSLDAKTIVSECYGDSPVDHDKILEHLAMDFTPYKYQRSLATPAIKGFSTDNVRNGFKLCFVKQTLTEFLFAHLSGLNSIIALKTGGGKTHTAAYIAKYHYVRSIALEKTFKGIEFCHRYGNTQENSLTIVT